ncbi:hypothetical protein P4H61_25035 [Paenibacillus peoriae]|uniref:hypothetical protein n=1 Tax=Paenibacillus peoriae TaxID=59893 RepID=UPI001110FAC6|nr:hypothetical protein [Paenibacillus peoriae]MEC0184741.1 hypothetical protein [Paenibacillus peoriae]
MIELSFIHGLSLIPLDYSMWNLVRTNKKKILSGPTVISRVRPPASITLYCSLSIRDGSVCSTASVCCAAALHRYAVTVSDDAGHIARSV